MEHSKKYCLLIVMLSFGFCMHAQDKIYYNKDKVDEWKVTEIAPGYIKGADVKNPQVTYSTNRKNILFIFNRTGNFLVVPDLYEKNVDSERYIRNFLKLVSNAFNKADRIITVNNTIITCKFETDSEQGVVYTLENKKHTISHSDLILVVFKDGHHKLYANVNKTYKVLKAIQEKYDELAFSAVKDSVQNSAVASQRAVHTPDTQRIKVIQASVKVVAERENDLDHATLASLQDKALFNIKELESYIKIISDKHSDVEKTAKAIDQALALFASENSMIEVSSVTRSAAQQYKVRVYLNRLGLMKYSKVIIEWYNVQYASKVRKNPDGTYTGYIEFEQLFTGLSGDRKQYQDVTRKTIEVILKPYIKKSGGEDVLQWNVFLGNIGISVTKPE